MNETVYVVTCDFDDTIEVFAELSTAIKFMYNETPETMIRMKICGMDTYIDIPTSAIPLSELVGFDIDQTNHFFDGLYCVTECIIKEDKED